MQALTRLASRLAQGKAIVAGVLSGTSADGIDVALARLGAGEEGVRPPGLLAYRTLSFEPQLGHRVRSVLDGVEIGPAGTALLSRDLGRAFGRAVRHLALEQGVEVDLVGSHGQTVYHHDGREPTGPATLQLGDGDCVAEESGAAVVSDFRARDVAAGGEGAPLSGLVDPLLFHAEPRPLGVLNLGGISNLTFVDRSGGVLCFDAGPAGCLLDGLARRLLDAPMDAGGERAASGRAEPGLLEELLRHPFFERAPPRSTGRDTFGEAWVDGVVARARELRVERDEDLLRTAVELSAEAVARSCAHHAPPGLARLLVAGGGARNRCLVEAIERRSGLSVIGSDRAGVDPDAREALVFAVLAARFVLAEPSPLPPVTGASGPRVLGKLALPSPISPGP